jgi:hypothetical protein
MAKTIWCAGEDARGGQPVWAPLLGVVGSLTSGFMWMYEVVLDNDRTLHVYKHRNTRRYLHLDTERNAWAYQHRHGRAMYRKVDLADALTEAFADWDRLACGPTSEERALIAQAISSARNRARLPLTTAVETVAIAMDAALLERARALVPPERSLADRATAEHALVLYALDREIFHGRSGPLTNPDASCLLCDELYQNDRLLVNEIDRGAAVDG